MDFTFGTGETFAILSALSWSIGAFIYGSVNKKISSFVINFLAAFSNSIISLLLNSFIQIFSFLDKCSPFHETGKQERSGILRGTMRKRVWVNRLDLLLVEPWSFETDKCSILHKYSYDDYYELMGLKRIPENFVLEEDQDKDLDDFNPFDINDSDDEDIDLSDDPDNEKKEIDIDDI